MEVSALKLVIVKGPREGVSLKYPPGSKIRIGRVVRGNNLTIKDAGISSKHVSIDFESGHWAIQDLDSSNGTLLNGKALDPGTPFRLSHGDSIKLGEFTTIDVELGLAVDDSCVRRNPRRRAAAKEKDGGVLGCEEVDGSAIEAVSNASQVGRSRKARGLLIEDPKSIGNVTGEGEAEKDGKLGSLRMSARVGRTRSAKNKGEVVEVSESSLGNIHESVAVECEEVKVEAKKTRPGGRKRKVKNVEKEKKSCSEVVELKNLEEQNVVLEEMDKIEEPKQDVGSNVALGNTEGQSGLEERENVEKPKQDVVTNVENECAEEKGKGVKETCEEDGEGGYDKVEKDPEQVMEKENENGGGDWPDLEKITLGEWLDFLEVYLPKQITDATEQMIEAMKRKAEQVNEYIKHQKENKCEVPVS